MTVEFTRNIHISSSLTQGDAVRIRMLQFFSAVLWPARTLSRMITQRRLRVGRLRIISRCTACAAFEYDPARDRLTAIHGETGALISTRSEGFLTGGGYKKMLPEHQWAQFENLMCGDRKEACGVFLVGCGDCARWLRLTLHHTANGRISGEATDVDELMRERECALTAAASDPLTGLYNRAGFEYAFLTARRRTPDGGLLILADVDNFKQINDAYGHLCGDAALRTLAENLRACLRGSDIIARFGGDEFVIFLPAPKECGQVLTASLARLSEKLTHIRVDDSHAPEISCSLGAALASDESLDELTARADEALYRVKRSGKAGFAIYSEEFDEDGVQSLKKHL